MSEFAIRPMQPGDEPFVYRAWLEGYWPHSGGALILTKPEWMARYHRVIERIMADKASRVLVAHVDGMPDSLVGFACMGDRAVHWVYVKQAFRGLHVAWALTDGCWPSVSHWTPHAFKAEFQYAPEALKEYEL